MGRSISENFKGRFGNPPWGAVKFEKKKSSFVDEVYRNKKLARKHLSCEKKNMDLEVPLVF